MITTEVEVTERHKRNIRRWINNYTDVEDRDARDWGIKAGLKYIIDRLELREHIHNRESTILLIPESVLVACRYEYEENRVNAEWNIGYSKGIFSVLYILDLIHKDTREPVEYINDWYNK